MNPTKTIYDALVEDYTSGAVPQGVVCTLAAPLFAAVGYLHSQDIIHRDLKPRNVMVRKGQNSSGGPVILDFGLAVVDFLDQDQRLTGSGYCVGTPPYMAPEQAAGDQVSGACDVYQLGQIMWEMLVGQPAFVERTAQQVLIKKTHEPQLRLPPDLAVDPRLASLVHRSTEAEPNRRPTPEQAVQALREIEEGPEAARPWWRFRG